MIEWLVAVIVLGIVSFLLWSAIEWLKLPSYVAKIANELEEIKEELKEKGK